MNREVPSLNIYFGCSLTGGREHEAIYGDIVDHLLALGHEVPTAHLAQPGIMDLERIINPAEVYQRDIAWIQASDGMIAEVSTPSHGVGYEIAFALSIGKPVLCCHAENVAVSKMLTGNDEALLRVDSYESSADALAIIDRFLEAISAP
jgi:nucleoside 2-deoxyribosyltransferase